MKFQCFLFFIIFFYYKLEAQHSLGAGIGTEFLNPSRNSGTLFYKTDISANYHFTWKFLALELRQSFRFYGSLRYMGSNTNLLVGFTTNPEKLVSYNILVGGVYKTDYPGLYPALKTGFYFRLSKNNKPFLGLDAVISQYEYKHSTGTSSDISGSLLISFRYAFVGANK